LDGFKEVGEVNEIQENTIDVAEQDGLSKEDTAD